MKREKMKKYLRTYCSHCEKTVIAEQKIPYYHLNAVITIATLGLWGITLWYIMSNKSMNCRKCKNVL